MQQRHEQLPVMACYRVPTILVHSPSHAGSDLCAGALSLQQSVTPACAPFQHIMSFHVNQLDTERVQSDTGKALSNSDLLSAPAQSRDPQV